MVESLPIKSNAVQRAFSKQAEHYDEDDISNQILIDWRKQVYENVNRYIKPGSYILELNAGTGIDALHFVQSGHSVHATDCAQGMIAKINQKIFQFDLLGRFTSQQCSFETLDQVKERKFEYVFSNFGGLNCCSDLTKVARHLPALLNKGAYVTLVIMPTVSFWELARVFRAGGDAFRRLKKNGTLAHLEGEYFKTYYHSLSSIKKSFGENFTLIRSEGLGNISPPPASANFFMRYPKTASFLKKIDHVVKNIFPFNRWGDHIIVTFQFTGNEDHG